MRSDTWIRWTAAAALAVAVALAPAAAWSATAPEEVHVVGVSTDFRERRDRMRGDLAAQVATLFTRKQAIDRSVDAAHDAVARSVRRQNAIQARSFMLRSRWRAVRTALERLWHAERGLPQQGVEAHSALIARIGRRMAHTERTIVSRTRAGLGTAVHKRLLARQRKSLLTMERALVERGPAATRDLRRKWLALQRDTHDLLFDLHVDNAAEERARAVALDRLTALKRERDAIDEQSYDAAIRLGALDFDVRAVRVRANGQEVFLAEGSTAQFEKLQRFETDRRLAKEAEDALRPEFDRVRHSFYAAQREVIAAEADLAARLDYLAIARFSTDLAFSLIDVGLAFRSGGPVGSLTEVVKKVAESRLSATVGSGYEPGSIEAEVNARYDAELADAYSAPQLMKVGMERIAEEAVTQPATDALNRALANALFGPLGHRLQAAPTDLAAQPLRTTSLRALLRAPERLAHTDKQIDELRKGGGPSLRSLGLAMLKDVAKVYTRGRLDAYEREAWIAFFERDMYARARYAIYAVVRDLYAQAEATRIWNEQRLLEHAAAGVSLRTGFANRVQLRFPGDAQLEIELRVATSVRPDALSLAVVAGGNRLEPVERRRAGDDVFLTYRVAAAAVESYYAFGGYRFSMEVR